MQRRQRSEGIREPCMSIVKELGVWVSCVGHETGSVLVVGPLRIPAGASHAGVGGNLWSDAEVPGQRTPNSSRSCKCLGYRHCCAVSDCDMCGERCPSGITATQCSPALCGRKDHAMDGNDHRGLARPSRQGGVESERPCRAQRRFEAPEQTLDQVPRSVANNG